MERDDQGDVGQLPRTWLPVPQVPDRDAIWDVRTERILAVAAAELAPHGGRRPGVAPTPWQLIGLWWKAAAGVAVAAASVLFLFPREQATREAIPPRTVPLNVVASNGDPVVLWEAFGVRAHPVLALIALQERDDETRTAVPTRSGGRRP